MPSHTLAISLDGNFDQKSLLAGHGADPARVRVPILGHEPEAVRFRVPDTPRACVQEAPASDSHNMSVTSHEAVRVRVPILGHDPEAVRFRVCEGSRGDDLDDSRGSGPSPDPR